MQKDLSRHIMHLESCIAIQEQDVVKAQLLHLCTCVGENNLIDLSRTHTCVQTHGASICSQILQSHSAWITVLRLASKVKHDHC